MFWLMVSSGPWMISRVWLWRHETEMKGMPRGQAGVQPGSCGSLGTSGHKQRRRVEGTPFLISSSPPMQVCGLDELLNCSRPPFLKWVRMELSSPSQSSREDIWFSFLLIA